MRPAGGLRRFEAQLRTALVLLVALLAALGVLNLRLLAQARADLASAEAETAKGRAREAVRAVGPEVLLRTGEAAAGEPALRRAAARVDLLRITLLDPEGRVLASGGTDLGEAATTRTLDPDLRAALSAGRTVAVPRTEDGEGEGIVAYVPLVDGSGRLLRVVEARHATPALSRLDARLRFLVAVLAGTVSLLAVLSIFLARWVSRPYRSLVEAAGDAGLSPIRGLAPDPQDLAQAFRAVGEKLREQERAIGSVERESEGLLDLVRFAAGPGRGMATGVLVVASDRRIAESNPAAEAILGLSSGEGKGKSLAEAAPAVLGLEGLVRRALETGQGASREVLDVRRPASASGHVGVAISPVPGGSGKIAGALVLMTDLTEIRKLQEQARLRESLATVGRVAAGIAHEIRNALGTILGYARMLEKREEPSVRGPAREILREVDAVRSAVDEFLLYARPPEPKPEPVDLGAVARAAAAAAPHGVSVEVEGEFGTVQADESLVRRVFGNLFQNAAEAGAALGRPVRVSIVGRRVGESGLLVDVEDDGPGIPPERRDEVFLPFVTGRAQGTGLGLALVQRTMLDLGGSVEVREAPGGGALFRLRFPLRESPAGRP